MSDPSFYKEESHAKSAKGNSDPKQSAHKSLESTLPNFFAHCTEDSYDENDPLSQATSEFQRSIVNWLKSGKSYDELMAYVKKECDDGKAAYDKQVAEERKRAAEADAKVKALSASRETLIRALMRYFYDLGLIEKKDISNKNTEKLIKIFKGIEENLRKKHSKLEFDPFYLNFDFNTPEGRRGMAKLWEDLKAFDKNCTKTFLDILF